MSASAKGEWRQTRRAYANSETQARKRVGVARHPVTPRNVSLRDYHLRVAPRVKTCICVLFLAGVGAALPAGPTAPAPLKPLPGWCEWPYRYWVYRLISLPMM